jgi:hypothetical protein
VLAKRSFWQIFPEKNKDLKLPDYKAVDKAIPFLIVKEFSGTEIWSGNNV